MPSFSLCLFALISTAEVIGIFAQGSGELSRTNISTTGTVRGYPFRRACRWRVLAEVPPIFSFFMLAPPSVFEIPIRENLPHLCEGSDDDDVLARRFPQACIRTCTCLVFVARLYVYNPHPFPRKLDDHSQDSFLYKVYSFLWTRGLSFLGVLRWAGPFGARWVFRLSSAVCCCCRCCCCCCCCCIHIKNHPCLVSIKYLLLSQHLRTNPPLLTRPI